MRHTSSWLAAVGIFLMAAALTLGWAATGEAQRRVGQTGQTTCYGIDRYVVPMDHILDGVPIVRDAEGDAEFLLLPDGSVEPNLLFDAGTGVVQDNPIACAGTGQDGEFQAGYKSAFIDKANGSIRDKKTGLVWEKKSDDGGIHDRNITRTWEEALAYVRLLNNICQKDENVPCATDADCKNAVVVATGKKLGGKCGFCGKRDWRVPNVKELGTLVNAGIFSNGSAPTPTIDPLFNNCLAGATVLNGSCTHADDITDVGDPAPFGTAIRVPMTYWTSTSGDVPGDAWFVDFFTGDSGAHSKDSDLDFDNTLVPPEVIFAGLVRAVRGGLNPNPNPDPVDD